MQFVVQSGAYFSLSFVSQRNLIIVRQDRLPSLSQNKMINSTI
jgi:hypothetical protein